MNPILIALEIMGNGMAGIFTAILVIIAAVWVMGRLDRIKEQKKK